MTSRRRDAPARNRFAHVLFAVLAAAVLVFVLTREDSPQPDPDVTTVPAMVDTTPPSEPATATTSRAATSTSAGIQDEGTTAATSPAEEFEVISPEALSYTQGLAGFKATLQTMVVEISAANSDWDNREGTGVGYAEIEASIVDVVQRVQALQQVLQDQETPGPIRDRHLGPGGPVQQVGLLVDLADAVLEGLRLPPPDDGSVRRAALADFIDGVEVFNRSVDDLIRHVEENASALGLTVNVSATTTTSTQPRQETSEGTTTTTTQPARQLTAEASSYVVGLVGFKDVLAELVETSSAANLAWDNSAETGVTYRATESALVEVLNRTAVFRSAVEGHRIPAPLGTRGQRIVALAAGLGPPAEAMLEGLRLPAPEDGSARRAALADFNSAAAAFTEAVDDLVSDVEENAESLGLMEDVQVSP